MAIYSKISGLWKENKTLYTKISGVWKKVSFAHAKVSGIWKNVFTDEYVYTFTANASNVNFATLIGAENVSKYTKFKIIVNPGVTISGATGANGANGSGTATYQYAASRYCKDSKYTDGRLIYHNSNSANGNMTAFSSNGQNGTIGTSAFNFSGMSGKTINLINNGTIKGGNGGNGGVGNSPSVYNYVDPQFCSPSEGYTTCAYSGAGAAGVSASDAVISGSNTLISSGNPFVAGNAGAAGATAWNYYTYGIALCCGGCG